MSRNETTASRAQRHPRRLAVTAGAAALAGALFFGGLMAYAAATTGAANLAACVICRDETEFYEFLTAKAATLPGVQRVETAPIIRTGVSVVLGGGSVSM